MRPSKFIWPIILIAFAIRIIYLGHIPLGFTADEASQGYSAYSLLKTGKDEWGLSWPLTSFRAFNDYHAPLQTYFIIPSVATFGLNEFAVRLPSAIFGTLAVLAIYLLTKELFKKDRSAKSAERYALLAALFLAISPWHIQFSRTALEANYASFFFPMGFYFLLRGIRENTKYLYYSACFFGIDLYSYHAARLFIPLFLLSYFLLRFKTLKKIGFKKIIPVILVFLVFAVPIFSDTLFGPGSARGKDLIITNFEPQNIKAVSSEQYLSKLNQGSVFLPKIFSNKITFIFKEFTDNYTTYLSPTFWFTEGGHEITYSVFPGYGLLYLFMFPLVVFGLYKVFTTKGKTRWLILFWLSLGIIPAAITKEGYRPNRVSSLLGFWEMISAVGFIGILDLIPKRLKNIFFWISGIIIFVSFIFYLNLYFFLSPVKFPNSLQYGYRDLVNKIETLAPRYDRIIIDRGDESQMFVAFYTKMDPSFYQQFSSKWWPQIRSRELGFVDLLDPYSLDKFTFKTFDENTDIKPGNLVVIKPKQYQIHPQLRKDLLETINYPDGSPAFYILTYVQEK